MPSLLSVKTWIESQPVCSGDDRNIGARRNAFVDMMFALCVSVHAPRPPSINSRVLLAMGLAVTNCNMLIAPRQRNGSSLQ